MANLLEPNQETSITLNKAESDLIPLKPVIPYLVFI